MWNVLFLRKFLYYVQRINIRKPIFIVYFSEKKKFRFYCKKRKSITQYDEHLFELEFIQNGKSVDVVAVVRMKWTAKQWWLSWRRFSFELLLLVVLVRFEIVITCLSSNVTHTQHTCALRTIYRIQFKIVVKKEKKTSMIRAYISTKCIMFVCKWDFFRCKLLE